MLSHRFDIRLTGYSNRGPTYEVLHNDAVLITRTTKPAADACRALVALGLAGPAEMWSDGKHCMSFPEVERAALLTTSEGEKSGPRVVKFIPFNKDAFSEPDHET